MNLLYPKCSFALLIKNNLMIMKKNIIRIFAIGFSTIVLNSSCSKSTSSSSTPVSKDITTAPKTFVDRFSANFGHLQVRTASNGLPAANAPVSFDSLPFITTGLTPTGGSISYYNFDVQSTTPDDIYVFFKKDSVTEITAQNHVIPTKPGDVGYNDFWRVNKVIVPDSYVPNSLTNEAAILSSGYPIIKTSTLVNCPVVPFGSTASRSFVAGTPSALTIGWYKDSAVAYFSFEESALYLTSGGLVPTAPIYVTFNNDTTGAASGFKTETGSKQTHNVLAVLPGKSSYSPLWSVQVESNVNFSSIKDLTSATSFTTKPAGANVNCPVVK